MIDSPWKSTTLKQHLLDGYLSEIGIAEASGKGIIPDGDWVRIVGPAVEKMEPFMMPFTKHEFGERNWAIPDTVYIDGRTFIKKDTNRYGETVVNNQTQYDFAVRLGELTAYWVKNAETRGDLMRASDLPASVFIGWLTGAITDKLKPAEDVARDLKILTGIYYAHLYHGADEVMSERGKTTVVKLVTRWTREPVQFVQAMVEQAQYMNMLPDYVNEIQRIFSTNTRLATTNQGLIIYALGATWTGFRAIDYTTVAIEYPPVFLALVEAACNPRLHWRKTGLGRRAETAGGTKKEGADFVMALAKLVGRVRAGTNR